MNYFPSCFAPSSDFGDLFSLSYSTTKRLTRNAPAFRRSALFALMFGIFSLPAIPALAGQTITFDGNSGPLGDGVINHMVFGNSSVLGVAPRVITPETDPNNNTVNINNGATLKWGVFGGWHDTFVDIDGKKTADDASASGNAVNITGGTLESSVTGGSARTNTGAAQATGNSVSISGNSTIKMQVYGGAAESEDKGDAQTTGNSVSISNGTVEAWVVGGNTVSYKGNSQATGNTVNISGGTVSNAAYGGLAQIFGTPDDKGKGNATATGNTVIISGGTVNNAVYGGYGYVVPGGSTSTGAATASGNTVTISGGTVNGWVYGGMAYSLYGTEQATGNTVNLSGSPIFGPGAGLSGGYTFNGGDGFTGNTLNVSNYSGSEPVVGVGSFQFYNFTFPVTQNTPILRTGWASFGDGTTVSTVTSINTIGGAPPLQPGASVTLIGGYTSTIDGSIIGTSIYLNGYDQTKAQGQHGAILQYDWSLNTATAVADKALIATLDKVSVNPETKAFAEGNLANMVLLNRGGNMVAGMGMSEALRIGRNNRLLGGKSLFTVIEGGAVKQKTGSHIDMKNFAMMIGATVSNITNSGEANIGAFLEYGNGSYDTYNKFANATIKGDGKNNYLGGGLLGRFDFAESNSGNLWLEGSLRAGKVRNDYHSKVELGGEYARFKTSSSYASLHLGTGYRWKLDKAAAFNLYGQSFYTQQGGDTVTLSSNDPVKFEAIKSNRVRLGGRYEWALDKKVNPYAGMAYEHEFGGKAKASTYGYGIDSPSLKGGTGIIEGGIAMKPTPTHPLTINLGLQGYMGKQRGGTGTLRIRYDF